MNKIIEIEAKKLNIGDICQDINGGILEPVLLKLIKHDETECLFEQISGDESIYFKNKDGKISFYSDTTMYKQVEA
jgi:hypothetical protein